MLGLEIGEESGVRRPLRLEKRERRSLANLEIGAPVRPASEGGPYRVGMMVYDLESREAQEIGKR